MTISPTEILFGVVGNKTSVVDITTDKIVMGTVANITSTSGIETFKITGSGNSYNISNAPTAGLRITSDSVGLVASQDSIILLDSDGIGVGSRNTSGKFSGIIIRPSDLVMTTAGTVRLYGTSGEILFGTSMDRGNANFYVDIDGNLYCKSLTVESGTISTTGNVEGTANIGTYSMGIWSEMAEGDTDRYYYADIPANTLRTGPYYITVNFYNSGYIVKSTCMSYKNSSAGASGSRGKLLGTAYGSGPISSSGGQITYLIPCDPDVNKIILRYSREAGNKTYPGSITVKQNFKPGSTEEDMNAGWSGTTYTAVDNNTNITLGTTTISGNWDIDV